MKKGIRTVFNTRNVVSRVFFKDNDGICRNIFTIEGDKLNDASVYVVQMNETNSEVLQTEENVRQFSLQKSLHVRKDSKGEIENHFKRNGCIFGRGQNDPKEKQQVSFLLHYGESHGTLEKHLSVLPQKNDIILSYAAEYFSDIDYIFYSNQSSLDKYVAEHKLFTLQHYSVPVKYADPLFLATVIKESRLIEIQKQGQAPLIQKKCE